MKPLKIAVVGAGIVGVSCAEWLRRDGHEVTLIDRVEPGSERQTSFGNAGLLARCAVVPVVVPGLLPKVPGMLLSKDSPLFLRWRKLPGLLPWLKGYLGRGGAGEVRRISAALGDILLDSVDQHLALARGTAAERYIRFGEYFYFYKDRAAYEADAFGWGLRRDQGIVFTTLEREALEAVAPGIGPDYGFAVAMPDHGWITDPGAYVAALAGHYRAEGGDFLQGEVEAIEPEGAGALLRIDGEALLADRVVLAAGAWSARLAKRLGHAAGLQSEGGYHLVLEEPSHKPSAPLMLADSKFAVTPMEGGLRLAGLVEFGGLDAPLSDAPVEFLRRRVRRAFPGITWKGESAWRGHRPSTLDSLPFVGASPKLSQIYFAFGAQHIGLTSGPKTGRLIADLIGRRRPNIDLSPFRVGRFD